MARKITATRAACIPPGRSGITSGIVNVEIRHSLEAVAPAAWDAVVGDGCPFFEHAFLRALETSGCVGPSTGWHPRYVLLRRGRDLVGALPLFRKEDSYGEFIFDWGWAQAAQRVGLPYYPKLVVAAPFSPVGGARFLLAPGEGDDARGRLLDAARDVARREPASGLHLLFVTDEEERFLAARGLAVRHTHQFQWHNAGYRDFDAFLERFRSKRRNQIRRERRRVRAEGVQIRVLEGEAIGPREIAHAWRFYVSTVDKFFYGRRYLNRTFFETLGHTFRHRLQLVFGERDGEVLAGALNVVKPPVLYGRYWGAAEEVPNLHFEVCSYAGIEAAIERGLARFEAGAGGGEHKFGRGFLPVVTRSAHEIYLPPLDRAVRDFLARERVALAAELAGAAGAVLKDE